MVHSDSMSGQGSLGPETGREVVVLVNQKARRSALAQSEIVEGLTGSGLRVRRYVSFQHVGRLREVAREEIRAGAPLVVVGGGDGTFSAIAGEFARTTTALGVLPLGTGNAFARDLGIPADLKSACEIIAAGKVASVDMGVVGGREFLNVATVGLTTQIARGLDPAQKKRFGRVAYLVSVLRALRDVQPFHAVIDLQTTVEDFDSLLVVIGNGRFHAGPFPVSEDASIKGGRLAIYALASKRKTDLVKVALRMLGGGRPKFDEIRSFQASAGRLSTDPIQSLTSDGEISLRTPVDFGIVAGALRVVVPHDFNDRAAGSNGV